MSPGTRSWVREVAWILLSWGVITALMLAVQMWSWHTPWDQVKWLYSLIALVLLIGGRRRKARSTGPERDPQR